jgi:hypothetical protein
LPLPNVKVVKPAPSAVARMTRRLRRPRNRNQRLEAPAPAHEGEDEAHYSVLNGSTSTTQPLSGRPRPAPVEGSRMMICP